MITRTNGSKKIKNHVSSNYRCKLAGRLCNAT